MLKKSVLSLFLIIAFQVCKAQSIQEYIENHFEIAQELMRTHKMPASLVLAVAIHESAAGKSRVAKHLNNHFGIKGKNESKEIKSAYRGYESINDSYADFVVYLKDKTAYSKLFDLFNQYDYQNWAKGIQKGGYAHSRTWASQVINLIKKYELYKYDERPEEYTASLTADSDLINPVKKTKIIKKTKTAPTFYTVLKGDNLSILAKKFKTTVAALMKLNTLKSTLLQPGKKLKIK